MLARVDGAHSFEYVRNDTEAAFELVSDRGRSGWDDYCRRLPEAVAFLNSLDRTPLFRLPGSRLVAWFAESLLRGPSRLGGKPRAAVAGLSSGRGLSKTTFRPAERRRPGRQAGFVRDAVWRWTGRRISRQAYFVARTATLLPKRRKGRISEQIASSTRVTFQAAVMPRDSPSFPRAIIG